MKKYCILFVLIVFMISIFGNCVVATKANAGRLGEGCNQQSIISQFFTWLNMLFNNIFCPSANPSFNAKNSGHATEQITVSWETHEIKV